MIEPRTAKLAGQEIQVLKGVLLPHARKEPGCVVLNTADRVVSVFGKPALRLYLAAVRDYNLWTHSVDEDLEAIYHEEYVYKSQAMWYNLSGEVPGPGRTEPPAAFQPSIKPEVFIQQKQYELERVLVKLEYFKSRREWRAHLPITAWGMGTVESINYDFFKEIGGQGVLVEYFRRLIFLLAFATPAQWERADAVASYFVATTGLLW